MARKKTSRPFFSIVDSGTPRKKREGGVVVERHVARDIVSILLAAFIVFTFLSLSGSTGILGDAWSGFLRLTVGQWGLYSLLLLGAILLGSLLLRAEIVFDSARVLGIVLLELSFLGLVGLSGTMGTLEENIALSRELGGYIGLVVSWIGTYFVQETGTRIVLFTLFLIAALLIFQKSVYEMVLAWREGREDERLEKVKLRRRSFAPVDEEEEDDEEEEEKPVQRKPSIPARLKMELEALKEEKKPAGKPEKVEIPKRIDWHPPSFDLLDPSTSAIEEDRMFTQQEKESIHDKLEQFNIDVDVDKIGVNVGPTVIQYTLEPPEGVKLSKITALKDDLALALATHSIRIEAPIPGKGLVGIEVPNVKRMTVRLRELLESLQFKGMTDSTLRLPLGKDVSGVPVIEALDAMPHLLIAGSTGAGKSVAINSFLISLLYQNGPSELKMIMVDPKRVELTGYNSIPHLLAPVITEPEKAINALRWTVAEMMRRYKACQVAGARNRVEYNRKMEKEGDHMPFIVFVIDELADLMMSSMKKEVETLICRIAQMARAVGIHLVIATQRPSVDVITGLIKANIPARVSFTTVSAVDSRTILDTVGAEDLIGKGDMLYVTPKLSKPVRVQGVFVSSEEIEKVITDIRMTSDPVFDDAIVEGGPATGNGPSFDEAPEGYNDASDMTDEELCAAARKVIAETGKASASWLQRRLKLGYARASRIIDLLEDQGVLGPARGAKPREIYITHVDSAE